MTTAEGQGMSTKSPVTSWKVAGLYFEACNCESVCPCYTSKPPTYGYCEGNCAWHITRGQFGDISLNDLNIIMVQRCDGDMRENPWKCWYYIDDRATSEQFDSLQRIFTANAGGHIGKFHKLWEVQDVKSAEIVMELDGWQHRCSIVGKLGLAIGLLKTEVGPTLCRLPNSPGLAAVAEEDWFYDGEMQFNYNSKNALTTTFDYRND